MVLFLPAATACQGPITADARRHEVVVTLSAAVPHQSAVAAQGSFVSVADSVALTVTPSGEPPIVVGQRLPPGETNVSFPFSVPPGSTGLGARVVNVEQQTILFEGNRTVGIDRDGLSVNLPVEALTAVMLVDPRVADVPPSAAAGNQTTVTVYNRGTGTVTLTISDPSQQQRITAPCMTTPCIVGASRPLPVTINVNAPAQLPFPVTFSSLEGNVSVVLRRPAVP